LGGAYETSIQPVAVAQPGLLFGRPATEFVRFQTLPISHKDHFDVTAQFLVCYNKIWRQISSTSRHR